MKEKTVALVNKMNAETEVKYNQILAEANLIETAIIANAKAQAAKIKAEADAYALKTTTEAEKENAEIVAKAIALEGQMESALMKGSKKKRKHLQIMNRLEAMNSLASNSKTVIYGDQGNNLMANIEAFKMVFGKA
jgi:regulator of protease activity HflC (stomatin/prohibitin superfamily)